MSRSAVPDGCSSTTQCPDGRYSAVTRVNSQNFKIFLYASEGINIVRVWVPDYLLETPYLPVSAVRLRQGSFIACNIGWSL